MTAFTEFIDITGSMFGRAPLVPGGIRAVYVTGSGGIAETAGQLAALKAAGMGALTLDQTPGLGVFAAGNAIAADVEPYAGTDSAAHAAVAARQARGESSLLYCSQGNWGALKADIASPAGVGYWVANWSFSLQQAEAFIDAHPDVWAVQFGDPASNPLTLVPGTGVTLAMAQADIDVCLEALAVSVLGGVPPPDPPPAPAPASAPPWPFPTNNYLGRPNPSPLCHSGYYSSVDNHVVGVWQQRMHDRGWSIAVDGFFGLHSYDVAAAFQAEKHLHVDGLVGPVTWAAAWTAPVT